jgi:pyridoxine 4-dehydrogenase
MYRCAF